MAFGRNTIAVVAVYLIRIPCFWIVSKPEKRENEKSDVDEDAEPILNFDDDESKSMCCRHWRKCCVMPR